MPSIKNHIITTIQAVKKNFALKEYKYCFELFGYDFIVDSTLATWLIEVNTNPCIEESSPLL
jgi:D-alanine-D-alanine ligase-like ATP-grasp enzyme